MAAHDDTPSIREIAELTARLRQISAAGRHANPDERAAFLADKQALIARIEAANRANADEARAEEVAHRGPQDQTRDDTDGDDASRGW